MAVIARTDRRGECHLRVLAGTPMTWPVSRTAAMNSALVASSGPGDGLAPPYIIPKRIVYLCLGKCRCNMQQSC
jgi:hypothetical protein